MHSIYRYGGVVSTFLEFRLLKINNKYLNLYGGGGGGTP